MLLPYPCLEPHHPCLIPHHPMCRTTPCASGIPPPVWQPTIPVWYPTCDWYPNTWLELHPCLESHQMSGTPSHLLSGIPPQCPTPPACLQCPTPIWPLLLLSGSNCPLPTDLAPACPPSWTPAPCHPYYPPATAIWPSCTLPSLPRPSGPPCPTANAPSGFLPSVSCTTIPTIWPSCPTSPSNCYLALLPLTIPSSPAIWHSWPQLPVPSGSLLLPLLPQSGPYATTPPNTITEDPLHPKMKFELFRVSKFSDVCFNLTSCGFNLIACDNNIFHLAWKNSQNSHEETPFPSIRYLYGHQ